MGKRSNKIHLGSPKLAFLFWNMYTLAGKIAISNTIIPQAEIFETKGITKPIPRIISARPLIC